MNSGPESLQRSDLERCETEATPYIYIQNRTALSLHLDLDLVSCGVSYQSSYDMSFTIIVWGSYETKNYTLQIIKCQHLWYCTTKAKGIRP